MSIKGVIGEVQYSFLQIYAPTLYSAVLPLHVHAPAPIKISFGSIWCGVGAVLRFGFDSFWVRLGQPKYKF